VTSYHARMTSARWVLGLVLAGCAHAQPQPAWSDDSRSDLAARGTAIDVRKEPPPPQAAPIPEPAPALVPAAAQSAAPVTDDDAPLPADAPVVRLLDAGAEPRTRLRYRLAGPRTEEMTLTTSMTMASSMGTITQPEMPTPGMRMLMSIAAAPAGKGELVSTAQVLDADAVDGPGLLPGLTDKVRAELRGMKGLTVQERLTTRGMPIKVEISVPPDASPTARSSLERMQGSMDRSTVLPAEPVGVGARWEVDSQVRHGGIESRQISRYRVRELSGTRLGLDIEVDVSAGAQEVALPNTNGASAHLDDMRGTGTGTVDLDLTAVVPRRGHSTVETRVSMKVPAGGQTLSLSTSMKVITDVHAGR
jgi:hypothetical protein